MIGNPIVHLRGRTVFEWSAETRRALQSWTVRDEHDKMPELPVEWAAMAYKMLGFKAPLEVFYATDMRCSKLRICIKEPLIKSRMATNGGLVQRFPKGDLFQHKRKGSKCHP